MGTKIESDNDMVIKCKDCHEQFTFTEGEQRFYEEKQLQLPKRCAECRKKKRDERNKV